MAVCNAVDIWCEPAEQILNSKFRREKNSHQLSRITNFPDCLCQSGEDKNSFWKKLIFLTEKSYGNGQRQCCQIFLSTTHQHGGKTSKWPQNIPNCHKIVQIDKNIPTSYIARSSKSYPNWKFWFESMPSGNPDWRSADQTKVDFQNSRAGTNLMSHCFLRCK
jgi:hypothetical protein